MSAPGLHAPAWLLDLVRTSRPAVPWRDVVRFAMAIPAPLALAVLVDGGVHGSSAALGAGVFATTGSLAATLAPQGGPLRTRLRRVAAATLFGAAGLVVGHAASGGGWVPVVVIALLSAFAAFVSTVGAVSSLGALQLLVYTALSSGLVTTLPTWAEVAFFAAGAAWATLLTLVQARTEQQDPDRAAVAGVFTAIATLLEAISPGRDERPDCPDGGRPTCTDAADVADVAGGRAEQARRALTVALNDAYDRVIHSRSRSAGRSRKLSELAGVLNAAAPLVEGTVAAARAGIPPDPADATAARSLAAALVEDRELGWERPPPLPDAPTQRRAVRHGIRLVWNVVGDPEERALAAVPRREPELRLRLHDVLDRTLGNTDSRSFAVRLALCMAIAEVARQVLPLQRPYWVLLTVAIVLKPDFGSVFTRAVHRGAGTLLGVLIGSALLAVVPRGGWILLAMAVAAGLMPWGRNANFGLFSVFQTPVVIMLLDLAAPGGAQLVAARLTDTLVGCAIVLVVGYLLWPQTWRAPLDDALHQVTVALDLFLQQAFHGSPAETRRARRATYRALTEVQTQLQRRLAEPPPISTRASAWWPVIVALERTSDAVTEAVIALRAGEPPPDQAQVEVVRRAVRQLADDVRAHRVPDDAELWAEGLLAPVAREVDTARRLVRESAPGRWQTAATTG